MGIKSDIDALFSAMTPKEVADLSATVAPARPGSAAALGRRRFLMGSVNAVAAAQEPAKQVVNSVVQAAASPFALDQAEVPDSGPGVTAYHLMGEPGIWRASHTRNFENFAAAYPRQWWALTLTPESPTRTKILATIWKTGRLGDSLLTLLWQEADRQEAIHNGKLNGTYSLPKKGDRIRFEAVLGRTYTKQDFKGKPSLRVRFSSVTGWAGHIDLGAPDTRKILPDPGTPVCVTASVLWVMPGDYVVLHGGDEGLVLDAVGDTSLDFNGMIEEVLNAVDGCPAPKSLGYNPDDYE